MNQLTADQLKMLDPEAVSGYLITALETIGAVTKTKTGSWIARIRRKDGWQVLPKPSRTRRDAIAAVVDIVYSEEKK